MHKFDSHSLRHLLFTKSPPPVVAFPGIIAAGTFLMVFGLIGDVSRVLTTSNLGQHLVIVVEVQWRGSDSGCPRPLGPLLRSTFGSTRTRVQFYGKLRK